MGPRPIPPAAARRNRCPPAPRPQVRERWITFLSYNPAARETPTENAIIAKRQQCSVNLQLTSDDPCRLVRQVKQFGC
jgi:hypothetical protein